jgi:Ca-activated chloride channel family protein
MRFANPAAFQYLWLLVLLVPLVRYLTKKSAAKIQKAFGARLTPFLTASMSASKKRIKFLLQVVALAFFVIALARPQSGKSNEKIKSEGVELIIAIDVSNSMLAEDSKPNRLEMAKKEISRLLDSSVGDRIGLVAFAGSALLLSPMTNDMSAVRMYLEGLSTNSVSSQGTNIQKALQEGVDAFERGGIDPDSGSKVTRVIVIVSDGEDNEPGAIEKVKELTQKGIRVFTLGVGTEKGAPIPVRDDFGNLTGYKKDDSGQVVVSQTKGTVLQDVAQYGKGSFQHLTFGGGAVANVRKEIDILEKTEFDSEMGARYDERYQPFLFMGLIIALIELLLGERHQLGRLWRGRFEVTEG